MPLYNVDIQKLANNYYWTNRYIVDAPDLVAAQSQSDWYVSAERNIHLNHVQFVAVRVSDQDPATDNYVTKALVGTGTLNLTTEVTPLFVVIRVDFSVGSGRPSRKFLRGCLTEAHVGHWGDLTGTRITEITNNYITPLLQNRGYVDPQGTPIISGAVHPRVTNRQLRRGSKRKARTVI